MDRIEIMNKRQDEAVDAVIENNGIGTCIMPTGSGKSFVFQKLVYKMLDLGWIQKGERIFFWAETNIREKNMQEEVKKFESIFGRNVHEDFNVQYHTYQSGATGERVMDCYDEIDFALSSVYGKVLANGATYKLGLTATNQQNSTVYRDKVADELINKVRQSDKATEEGKITDFINKGQLLEVVCPIVYEYKFEKAIEEKVISPFQTIVLEHELDRTKNDIKIWKSYDRRGSEHDWYQARESIRTNYRVSRYRRGLMGKDQAKFLYNLPSKIDVVKRLLPRLEGKTILFSVETSGLYQVTNNVVTTATKNGFVVDKIYYTIKKREGGDQYFKKNIYTTVEKKINKAEYEEAWDKYRAENYQDAEELIDKFNADEINLIASSKKISRGITLKGVENCILMSYYSTTTQFLQQLGRVLRFSEGKVAKLFIFKTQGTREVDWFQKLPEVKDDKGQVAYRIPLNITRTIKTYEL